MELGYDGVLLNTAVARAGDPSAMARAFSLGIEAGRAAFFAKITPVISTYYKNKISLAWLGLEHGGEHLDQLY